MPTAGAEEPIKAWTVSETGEMVVYIEAYGENEWQEAGVPINYSGLDYLNRIGQFYDYMDATDPDVTFLVGANQERIRAHRIILTANSPVFRSMFYGSLECEAEIAVPDCTIEAFRALIHFCYKQECTELSVERAMEYLYTAKKYLAAGFEECVTLYLNFTLETGHVFEVLKMAEFYVLPQLIGFCWKYIEEHSELVLSTHFNELNLETMLKILANQELNISEPMLFNMTLEWAKSRCRAEGMSTSPSHIRKVGDKAFKLLRIPAMSGTELATIVAPTGIFTDEEMANFFISVHTPEFRLKPKLEFSALPRRAKPELTATDLGLGKDELREKFIRLLTELVIEVKPELEIPSSIPIDNISDWFVEFFEIQDEWIPYAKRVLQTIGDLFHEF